MRRYHALGIAEQIDYEKFYLYSIITYSTAIECSTVTEMENQLLFDEGISPAGKPLVNFEVQRDFATLGIVRKGVRKEGHWALNN